MQHMPGVKKPREMVPHKRLQTGAIPDNICPPRVVCLQHQVNCGCIYMATNWVISLQGRLAVWKTLFGEAAAAASAVEGGVQVDLSKNTMITGTQSPEQHCRNAIL